ncbi:selenide,water dikinase [Cyanobium sp. PCC 7001]|uniref:selenide, water dikinase SelD n=1 Tax=Cyanobium sp. PCC 7001 TaxID=180281 RepID=UPI00018056EF|nr:selenide, water dikinase SelD [Cyanobium sp. PCC 7001]EDY38674.1 selenide,water dikinase [Cyanobium sp. PCC 7001]
MQNHGPAGHLVLAGGGHTHALLLNRWAMGRGRRPRPGEVSLVSRHSTALYSGMVPGLVAGLYAHHEAAIDLRQLCRRAGVAFIQAEIVGLDPGEQSLLLEGRPALRWDWLSLDVGSVTAVPEQPAGQPEPLAVKPLEPFLAWADQLGGVPPRDAPVRIRGGGAAGVELALALRRRALPVRLLLRGQQLDLGSPAANRLGDSLLEAARVEVRRGAGSTERTDLTCTGSRAPAWLGAAGLPTDPHGRVLSAASLQVQGHPRLFVCGDCGVIAAAPRPPSGVWAVRAAPTLAVNLERCLEAGPARLPRRLRHWRPQRWALQLLGDGGTGGGGATPAPPGAIALWGPLAVGPSRWLWRWKDRIDRQFMQRFQPGRAMAPPNRPAEPGGGATSGAMACRGCAAKLPAGPLLAALHASGQSPGAEDAAAVGPMADGTVLLQSVDGFPALVEDPWLNGRLTALHACSDLWASGARLHSALAVVTVPEAAASLQQEVLHQTLAGIRSVLEAHGAPLLGGHTLEARDGGGLVVTLSVNGSVERPQHWPKGPLRPGDALLLSRPLGTGVLFAAAMAAAAEPLWIDQALSQMQQSQASLVSLLRRHGCTACTDVTGFGLLGHLGEMVAASPAGLRVELDAAAIPALPGALELLEAGHASSLAPANATALELLQGPIRLQGAATSPLLGLLIDPQTCGPLLAAVPGPAAAAALETLRRAGFPAAAAVGQVLEE